MGRKVTVKILGVGTSTGVPLPGCRCSICLSSHPRNKRLRSSIAFKIDGATTPTDESRYIVVDTTPDFRYQCLRAEISRVDAVVYTHHHADHIFGLDDLRSFNFSCKTRIPLYAAAETARDIRFRFNYAFDPAERTKFSTPPQLELQEIRPFEPIDLCGIRLLPLAIGHGDLSILGFKVGDFAYITDCNSIPDETLKHLVGIDTIILDALRHRPHGAHFTVEEALQQLEAIKPRKSYLTHLSHELDYDETNRLLSENTALDVELAYDMLEFELPGSPFFE